MKNETIKKLKDELPFLLTVLLSLAILASYLITSINNN